MAPPTFAKLDKLASDFFKADDFDLNKKVSLKTVTDNGITFTGSVSSKQVKADPKFPEEVDRIDNVGNIKLDYKNKTVGEIGTEVDTANLFSLTWKPQEIFNTKAEIKAKYDKKIKEVKDQATKEAKKALATECFVSVEDTYTKDNLAVTAFFKASNPADKAKIFDSLIGASAVVGFGKISVGGEAEHNLKELTKGDLGAAYTVGDVSLAIKTSNVLKNVAFSYHQSPLERVKVSAIGTFNFKEHTRGLKLGLAHDIDSSSSLRGAFAVDEKSTTLSSLFHFTPNSKSKVSVSSIIDLKKFSSGAHKFGVKLELGDL